MLCIDNLIDHGLIGTANADAVSEDTTVLYRIDLSAGEFRMRK